MKINLNLNVKCQNKNLDEEKMNIDNENRYKFGELPYLTIINFKRAVYYSCFKLRYLLDEYRSYRLQEISVYA